MKKVSLLQHGFTLQELLIVLFVITTMFALVIGNIFRSQQQASLHSRVQAIIADIRGQQLKAMTGEVNEGTSPVPYGIYFESDKYIVYKGETYNQSDAANTLIDLEETLIFEQNLFPSSALEFNPITGEMENYVIGQNEITVRDTATNEVLTIRINKKGVIYEVE